MRRHGRARSSAGASAAGTSTTQVSFRRALAPLASTHRWRALNSSATPSSGTKTKFCPKEKEQREGGDRDQFKFSASIAASEISTIFLVFLWFSIMFEYFYRSRSLIERISSLIHIENLSMTNRNLNWRRPGSTPTDIPYAMTGEPSSRRAAAAPRLASQTCCDRTRWSPSRP